ncbi:histone acetyltransferase type B catalytic subunit-like [Diaphorina citri]|nr:histone acetyltransferase type B catalytic subunit-like [Diaphorina citri]
MRDYVDVSNCAKLTGWSKEQLVAGYTPAMEKQVYEELKLCKKQARRVYEILRLGATNMNNSSEYKQYRLLVKNRLNAPHQKDVNYQKRLNKVLKPEEMKTFSCLDTEQQRKDKLHSEYKELEKAYLKVIERVKNYPFEN